MNEELEDFLDWLGAWAEAYPEDIFPPVNLRAVELDKREYSHAEVMSIAQRNAAAMGRHCIGKVLERAKRLT